MAPFQLSYMYINPNPQPIPPPEPQPIPDPQLSTNFLTLIAKEDNSEIKVEFKNYGTLEYRVNTQDNYSWQIVNETPLIITDLSANSYVQFRADQNIDPRFTLIGDNFKVQRTMDYMCLDGYGLFTNTFQNCNTLTEVDIEIPGVPYVELYNTFENCTSLKNVILKYNGINEYGYQFNNTFKNCTSLSSIYIYNHANNNEVFTSISNLGLPSDSVGTLYLDQNIYYLEDGQTTSPNVQMFRDALPNGWNIQLLSN